MILNAARKNNTHIFRWEWQLTHSTLELGRWRQRAQECGHSWLHSKFESSLGYVHIILGAEEP